MNWVDAVGSVGVVAACGTGPWTTADRAREVATPLDPCLPFPLDQIRHESVRQSWQMHICHLRFDTKFVFAVSSRRAREPDV